MFGSCSSHDSDEEEDSLPTSSPRPTHHCNKNVGNQHYSQSPRCIFQRSPFLSLQSNDDELMSRLSTLPVLDSISSAHKIGMKQEASTTSSKIPLPPSPPPRRRILPIPPQHHPQLVTTTTITPTTEDIKISQSSSSKRPSGSCLRRSRYSFPSELSEIAARNVDYVLSDSKSVSFYSQVSVLEFENDQDDNDDGMKVESWFKNFSRGFGIES